MIVVLVILAVIAGSAVVFQIVRPSAKAYEPGSDECKQLLSQTADPTRGVTVLEARCLGQM